jgi:hypothetical protein
LAGQDYRAAGVFIQIDGITVIPTDRAGQSDGIGLVVDAVGDNLNCSVVADSNPVRGDVAKTGSDWEAQPS